MIKEAIAKLVSNQPLSREEAAAAMTDIMSGNAEEAQIGAFIAGLRCTGETPEVIAGCAEVMRSNATKINCADPHAVDIVGTGFIVDRSGNKVKFGVPKYSVYEIPVVVYEPDDCPLCKKGTPIDRPGSRKKKII